jgi:predicted transcriptional regulator
MTTTLTRKKRDMSQCVMSVLECLNDQQYDEGVMKQDLMYRCGLNFHYVEQIMNYLIINELIYKSSTQPRYRENSFRYYLTEKGFKLWADLGQHLEPLGYKSVLSCSRKISRKPLLK